MTQVVEELLDLDPLVVVEILRVFEELRQPFVVEVKLGLEPIGKDFDWINRDGLPGLGMELILDRIQDVLGQFSPRVGHADGAAALTDQGLDGEEYSL